MSATSRPARRRLALPPALGVAAYLLALAVFVTWPLAVRLSDGSLAAEAEADLLLCQYLVLWGAHALVDGDAALAHTNMFHPTPNTYGYSDMPLANSLAALPLVAAGATPDQVYGLLLLGSLVAGGVGMVALARRLGLPTVAALAAATVYVANPAHVARYRNLQQFSDHWLPWLLWALLGWLAAVGLRRSPDHPAVPAPWIEVVWRSSLVAALLSLHALTGSHNAVFGAVVGGATVLAYTIAAGARPWRDGARAARIVAGAAVVAVLVAAVLAPIFSTYLEVYDHLVSGRLGDPAESARVVAGGAAGARELLSGASDLWMAADERLGWPGAWIGTGRPLRAHLFPGLLPLLLAAVGGAALRPRSPMRRVVAWSLDALGIVLAAAAATIAWTGAYPGRLPGIWMLALVALAALGARVVADREAPHLLAAVRPALRRRWNEAPGRVLAAALLALCTWLALGPDGGLYRAASALPGIGLIRAPSRFWLPGLVALGCLAGFGAETLRRRLGGRAPLVLAATLALFLAEAELIPLRIWHVPYPPDELTEWLARQPGRDAVLEVPIDLAPPAEVRQMIRSTHHWKPLLVGYSGSEPPGYLERMERIRSGFPSSEVLDLLRALGVGWIVVDRGLVSDDQLERVTAAPALEPAASFGTRDVYRLR